MAGEIRRHGRVTGKDGRETADALAIPRVHLVRHGGRAGLAFLKSLGQQTGSRHQPHRRGETRTRRAYLVQRADDVEIETARINLPDRIEGRLEAQVLHHARLELVDLPGVTAEEREL